MKTSVFFPVRDSAFLVYVCFKQRTQKSVSGNPPKKGKGEKGVYPLGGFQHTTTDSAWDLSLERTL